MSDRKVVSLVKERAAPKKAQLEEIKKAFAETDFEEVVICGWTPDGSLWVGHTSADLPTLIGTVEATKAVLIDEIFHDA